MRRDTRERNFARLRRRDKVMGRGAFGQSRRTAARARVLCRSPSEPNTPGFCTSCTVLPTSAFVVASVLVQATALHSLLLTLSGWLNRRQLAAIASDPRAIDLACFEQ